MLATPDESRINLGLEFLGGGCAHVVSLSWNGEGPGYPGLSVCQIFANLARVTTVVLLSR